MDNHRKGANAATDFQIRQRRLRCNYGVSQELLSASDVVQLEPRLSGFEGGLFFPKAINLSYPGEVMRLLSSAVRRAGTEFVRAPEAMTTVQLDTERGYHIECDMPGLPIERPVCPTAYGFYLCPMQDRLRVAGLVDPGAAVSSVGQRNARRLSCPSRPGLSH
ncbi:FAD-dependent oxidoreductase [Rhizobium miluonense]|uniref:D-amino-acid dehydrogenase n=1 Tax=Rhizobium miluonense TaxID=411945 RepID=A0A1C3U8M2_9HYPH|nr:FAD-dependent oxidoreductase [Rhizobium miluonense]SCB11828.1 D-amino-acid dehydrogenase [Rhizobium miluonense]